MELTRYVCASCFDVSHLINKPGGKSSVCIGNIISVCQEPIVNYMSATALYFNSDKIEHQPSIRALFASE